MMFLTIFSKEEEEMKKWIIISLTGLMLGSVGYWMFFFVSLKSLPSIPQRQYNSVAVHYSEPKNSETKSQLPAPKKKSPPQDNLRNKRTATYSPPPPQYRNPYSETLSSEEFDDEPEPNVQFSELDSEYAAQIDVDDFDELEEFDFDDEEFSEMYPYEDSL